jgi:hypothetical protein
MVDHTLRLTGNSTSFLGVPKSGNAFGGVLAAGDFNGDGKADLALGMPNFDSSSFNNSGGVLVLHGTSASKLVGDAPQFWSGIDFHPVTEAGARLGAALAVGDFNSDFKADLAIGVPLKDIVVSRSGQLVALQDAGEVTVLYGSASGLQ